MGRRDILDTPIGAELVADVAASPNLFSLLGVQPILGRGFSVNEQISNYSGVVVLSYAMWQQFFAGDHDPTSNPEGTWPVSFEQEGQGVRITALNILGKRLVGDKISPNAVQQRSFGSRNCLWSVGCSTYRART